MGVGPFRTQSSSRALRHVKFEFLPGVYTLTATVRLGSDQESASSEPAWRSLPELALPFCQPEIGMRSLKKESERSSGASRSRASPETSFSAKLTAGNDQRKYGRANRREASGQLCKKRPRPARRTCASKRANYVCARDDRRRRNCGLRHEEALVSLIKLSRLTQSCGCHPVCVRAPSPSSSTPF